MQVSRALPCRTAGESACFLPETAEILRPQCTQTQTTQGSEEEVTIT